MSTQQKLNTSQNPSESKQSNGSKQPQKPATNRRRRNRPHKSVETPKELKNEPKLSPTQKPKDTTAIKKEEKFVHTVFGGMSKEKFQKQKQTKESPRPSTNPVPIQSQRKVTVTANKSVIVSVIDTNLNRGCSIEETRSVNVNENQKIYSSSLNEKEIINSTINNNTTITTSNVLKNFVDYDQVSNKFEIELERNYVFKMKKSKTDKFRCNICNYFCDTIEVARKHINGQIHRNNLETIRLDMRIRDLELPSQPKLDNLSSFLIDFYSKNVITPDRLKQFYDVYYKFKEKFLHKYPNASVNMTGSILHGVCFNDSSCDISVEHDPKSSKSSTEILNEIDLFIRQEMTNVFDLNTETKNQAPKKNTSNKLTFKLLNSNLYFNFTNGHYSSSFKTNFLLKCYLDLDERARVLAFCFRYLAKLAQIDKVDLCTLPPHAYILMSIYFLQKLNPPVLPILHEICDSKRMNKSFIRQIEKTMKQRLNSVSSRLDSTNELFDSYEDDNEDYRSTLEKDTVQDFKIFKKNLNNFVEGKHWKSQNQTSIGELWLKLLTFYSIDFGFKKTLVSIRRSTRISKSSMKMYTKKISIEDPFYLKQSLSRNLLTQTNKYIISVISKASLYFVNSTHYKTCSNQEVERKNVTLVDSLIDETGIMDARKARNDLENTSDIDSDSENEGSDDEDLDLDDELVDFLNGKKMKINSENNGLGPSLVSSVDTYSSLSTPLDTDQKFSFEDTDDRKPKFDLSGTSLDMDSIKYEENLNEKFRSLLNISNQMDEVTVCLNNLIDLVVEIHQNTYDTPPLVNLTCLQNDKTQTFSFKFTQAALNFSKAPPKICSHCNKEGHLQNECPQDQLPDLDKLPDMTETWRDVLTNVCFCIMEDNKQTRQEEQIRNQLLSDIKSIIGQKYPDAKLSLFGSSNNGFAMKKSDLDICMTLENDPKGYEINPKKIIRTIGGLFRRDSNFDQIEERVSAKVPIVKFRHKKSNIEGDISLYNTLALQNTDLLRSYVEIDSRLQVLGHVVKHFAKICRIGDASCGSLSSYAYIVMMLHYLMNTDPPVLPCLQRLNRDKLPSKETSLSIDGWDCWFNRDLANLSNHWVHYNKNTMSIGELWLGFLRYYTEVFDWDNHVVCIRETNPLTRKEKNWTKHRLAIEDPFELSHNLAAGVSHKMGLYILRSFSKARSLFGNIVYDFRPHEIRFNLEYFFNPRSLVEGNPPMDRNCYSCLKIGHQTKDCPLANAKRRERQLSDMFDGRQEDMNNVQCYRCRQSGHKAKDCTSEMKRVKTTSLSINEKCFNCYQTGHYARDCLLIQGKIEFQQNIPQVPHQQSAPPPKMVQVISNPPSHPVFFKTGEKTQLVVNNQPGLNQISTAPLLNNQTKQYQNGRYNTQQYQPSVLNRQQSYPNQYPKSSHSEHIYHQNHQQYNIMTNESHSLNNLQYSSPTNHYTFGFSSPLGTSNSLNQVFSNQYAPYSPPPPIHYYIYNNAPATPLQISDYKVFGANLGRLDEKNIDLDIVQLNPTNLTKP